MIDVRVEGLTKRFGNVLAIENITFEAERGNFTTILGPSGSGKTTVLRCIAGVEEPDAGTISVGERLFCSVKGGIFVPPEQRGVGMVYQSYALWPHMTVFENVAYPLRARRLPEHEIRAGVLKTLGILEIEELRQRLPGTLSGGQQQRVALARALVYQPSVLLLDEPLSNLDERLRASVSDELKSLQRRIGITMIHVTHDRREALALSDNLVLLNGGKVMVVGKPSELLRSPPNSYVASFLGGMLVLEGKVLDTTDETTEVETAMGRIFSRRTGEQGEGSVVKVAVRTYEIELRKNSPGRNALDCTVRGRSISSANLVEYRITIGAETVTVAKNSESSLEINPGEKAYACFPESACILLRA